LDPPAQQEATGNIMTGAGVAKQNEKIEPAGFGARAGAIGIDLLILFALHMPMLWLLSTRESFMTSKVPLLIADMMGLAYCGIMAVFLPFWLYPSWFESSKIGGTPGQYLMGLEVINRKDNHFSFWTVVLRLFIQYAAVLIPSYFFVQLVWNLVPYLMPDFAPTVHRNIEYVIVVVWGIGTLWCFANPRKQTLFDLPLGRRVVFARTDAATGASIRGVSMLTRLKQLPRLVWDSLPRTWGRVPLAIYFGICLLGIANDGIGLMYHWHQVQTIEAQIEKNGGADHFGQSLTDLHIKAYDAWWSYDRVTELLAPFIEKKTLRVYLTRQNLLMNRLYIIERIAKVDSEYQNETDYKDFLDYANTKVNELGVRGQAYALAAGVATNNMHRAHLLSQAVAYAPLDRNVLKAKLRFDNEAVKMDDIKADQALMDIALTRTEDITDAPEATDPQWLKDKLELSKEIIKHSPKNTLANLISAQALALSQDPKDQQAAETLFGQITEFDPSDPIPFARRALFYTKGAKPNWDKAVENIDRALALDVQPEYLELKLNALEKKKKGDINAIRDTAEQLLRRKKNLWLLTPHAKYLADHKEREEAQRLVHAACTSYSVFPSSRLEMEEEIERDPSYDVIIVPLRICSDITRDTLYDQGKVEINDLISQVVPEKDRERVRKEVEKGAAAKPPETTAGAKDASSPGPASGQTYGPAHGQNPAPAAETSEAKDATTTSTSETKQ
jgi:uncharacterized RDD family membrane protein YckC